MVAVMDALSTMVPDFIALGIRHRSYRAPFACNPGLIDGGLMGESKAALQSLAPGVPWLRWALLAPATLGPSAELAPAQLDQSG